MTEKKEQKKEKSGIKISRLSSAPSKNVTSSSGTLALTFTLALALATTMKGRHIGPLG